MDISKIPTDQLLVENPEEAISALAFNIGRLMEHVITTKISHAEQDKINLEAKILYFRKHLHDKINLSELPVSTEEREIILKVISNFDSIMGIQRIM